MQSIKFPGQLQKYSDEQQACKLHLHSCCSGFHRQRVMFGFPQKIIPSGSVKIFPAVVLIRWLIVFVRNILQSEMTSRVELDSDGCINFTHGTLLTLHMVLY